MEDLKLLEPAQTNTDADLEELGTSPFWVRRRLTQTTSPGGRLDVPLPSGRGSLTLSMMTGVEENLFARDNRSIPVQPFFDVLTNCSGQKLDYKTMLMDDFMFGLFVVRRLTYGDYFTFKNKCGYCSQVFTWEEDLSQRPIRFADGEAARVYNAGEEATFHCQLPISGHEIEYTVPRAYDQVRTYEYARGDKRDRLRTEALKLCIRKFDGVGVVHGSEFEALPAFDLRYFEARVSELRVGVDPDIKVTCPHCRATETIELPVGSADFLATPSKEMKLRADGRLTALWGSRR